MMLPALQDSFEQLTAGLELELCTPAWMTATPVRPHTGARRLRLAPGVWIVRQQQWWPVSVLDIGEITPPGEAPEPEPRAFPHPPWHQRAACRDVPDADDLFFGVDEANHPALPPTAIDRARALCRDCPVAQTCLTWALETREEFGIWAGTTGRQRAKLQKRRRRGVSVARLVSECLE